MAALSGLETEIAALYRLPLAEFIASRDALAARCRSAGEREAAGRVKKLAKPSASAWAVNQINWSEAAALQRFFAAARRVREAQLTGEPAAAVRAAAQERRDALAALNKRAEDLLQGAGHGTAPSILRRVSGTLEAIAHRAVVGEPVPLGCLAEDLDPPGLDVLAGLGALPPALPSAEAPQLRGDPKAGEELDARADAALPAGQGAAATHGADAHAATRFRLAQLEAAAARARRRAQQAAQERATMEERLAAARAELQEAQRRLARAEQRLGDAEASLREAQASQLAAEGERLDAERALEEARS